MKQMGQCFYLILNLGLYVVLVKHCTREVRLTITELPCAVFSLVKFDLSRLSVLSSL